MRAANTHSRLLKLLSCGAAVAALMLGAGAATAGKFKVVHSFCSQPQCGDGKNPTAPLTRDAEGNLYGTTTEAGGGFSGTAYRLTPNAKGNYKFNVMARFSNLSGTPNNGALVMDANKNFYGMYTNGGLFELKYGYGHNDKRWLVVDISPSCSQQPDCGSDPVGTLTYAGASSGAPWDGSSPLYGMTNGGGINGVGTVFSLIPNGNQWTQTVLYNFCSAGGQKCMDGAYPLGGLVLDRAGDLFGTTLDGGGNDDMGLNGNGSGVAFELSQQGEAWSETVLHAFCAEAQCSDGGYPFGLSIDSAGHLFGAAAVGGGKCHLGKNGCGVIFGLVPNGEQSQETVLYTFCRKRDCADGAYPAAPPIVTTDGKLLGTTENGGGNDIDGFGEGGGVAYELNGASYQVLHHFCALPNCADGEYPESSLVVYSTGQAIGTASRGGAFNGGDIFSVETN